MYSRSLLERASQVDSPEFFAQTDEEKSPDPYHDKENQPNVGAWEEDGPHEKSNLTFSKFSEDQTQFSKGSLCYSSSIKAANTESRALKDLNTEIT